MIPILKFLIGISIRLGWDQDADPSVTGYKIYQSETSQVYGDGVDVGNVLTFDVNGLLPSTTYFFSVSAYNKDAESNKSTEISYLAPTIIPTSLEINQNGIITLHVYKNGRFELQRSQDLVTWTSWKFFTSASDTVLYGNSLEHPSEFFRILDHTEDPLRPMVGRKLTVPSIAPSIPSAVSRAQVIPQAAPISKFKQLFKYKPGMHFDPKERFAR